MVAVFFGRCAVCVVVVCGSRVRYSRVESIHRVRYDSISIRWFFVVFFYLKTKVHRKELV